MWRWWVVINGNVMLPTGRVRGDAAFEIAIHASGIHSMQVRVDEGSRIALERDVRTGDWTGEIPIGSCYVVAVDGERLALDPVC